MERKAVIYARYSSERQTEQSIEGQLHKCNEFAKQNDLLVVNQYIDRATTGTNDKREAFQAMLRDSEKGGWSIVLVYAIDRFGRNSIELAINKQKLKKNGVSLISATQRTSENIDGTKNLDGILLENVYIGLAEYYSAELSLKVKRGMDESRLKNQFTGGIYPYGYDIIDKKYVINKEEAEVVRRIFTEYLNGKDGTTIANSLNNDGFKTKKGKAFTSAFIYKILKYEKYIGIVRQGDIINTETIPPIIDKGLFYSVQTSHNKISRAHSWKLKHNDLLLTGKLYCGECNHRMVGDSGTSKNGNVYRYYSCTGRKRKKICSFPNVKKDTIENLVFKICCDVLKEGFIPSVAETAFKVQQQELEENILLINLKSELADKEKTQDNIINAIEKGIFNDKTKSRLDELETRINELKAKIEEETYKINQNATKEDYINFLSEFVEKKQGNNEEFKKTLINFLVRKVTLFRDKIRVSFYYTSKKNLDFDNDIEDIKEELPSVDAAIKNNSSVIKDTLPPVEYEPNFYSIFLPDFFVIFKRSYWIVWVSIDIFHSKN